MFFLIDSSNMSPAHDCVVFGQRRDRSASDSYYMMSQPLRSLKTTLVSTILQTEPHRCGIHSIDLFGFQNK